MVKRLVQGDRIIARARLNPDYDYEQDYDYGSTTPTELACARSISGHAGRLVLVRVMEYHSKHGAPGPTWRFRPAAEAGASLQTLTHAIGHASGQSNMYESDAGNGFVSEDKTYPLNWSVGEGTGYYSSTLASRDLTYRVIMNAPRPSVTRADIPL